MSRRERTYITQMIHNKVPPWNGQYSSIDSACLLVYAEIRFLESQTSHIYLKPHDYSIIEHRANALAYTTPLICF